MKVSDFDYHLPDTLIAHAPAEPRDASRLLHVSDTLSDMHVYDLPSLLRAGDVLVFNDSKVIPARLYGVRYGFTGRIEVLLHKCLDDDVWEAWAKPAKKLVVGETVLFAKDFTAVVTAKTEEGPVHLRFDRSGAALFAALHEHGLPPLPPYIQRAATAEDVKTYQTVYADREGSVAAPTAGLHFTKELLSRIDAMGVTRAHVTLHVGAGTFRPMMVEDSDDHVMHAEWGEVSAETAQLINNAKAKGGRVVTVGTTSTRLIETASDDDGIVHPFCGDTALFITPGYKFKTVGAIMTNFHLPKSTLLMLVSAFAGMEKMRAAYRHAIANGYRFYSYGDSCFLEPSSDKI